MRLKKYISRSVLALFMSAGLSSFSSSASALEDGNAVIKEVSEKEPEIKVVSSGIEISNPEDSKIEVAVYALTGKLIKQVSIPSGVSVLDLSPGFYIVKCGSVTKRIAIK